ncbi:PREDICTED: E3 ubiquitin-protein ligase TRIM71-like [Amphimedon queenslandica]|nr:PREDICTED: E3 ubiquitin-protein ligase TRIM71-like [Amphimedon queenslandica]|eukprot:XP_019859594.1 PREDICTED: E3 ubiquitin-protein ligase TRIM71-like [Amphimedon queenslandica]
MALKTNPFLLKLKEQLTCAKCHGLYTSPRILPCHHSFCQNCIEVREVQKVLYSVQCPSCDAEPIELSSLDEVESKFSVTPKLNELRDVYDSMKESEGIHCGNCFIASAASYCKDCNKTLCNDCIDAHKKWSEFATHAILGLEEALKAPTESMIEEEAEEKVTSHVSPILSAISGREAEIREQGEAVKEEIRSFLKSLTSSLEDKFISEVDEIIDRKLQMLEKQKKESLNTSHEIKELEPVEKADIQFIGSKESISHHVGSVVSRAGLEECKVKEIATIKHMPEERAISFELSIELPNHELHLDLPASSISLSIEPASANTTTKHSQVIDARVIPTDKPRVYQVICTPVIRGRHQVCIKALGIQLKTPSSFTIPFNPYIEQVITPIRTIGDVQRPCGVAVSDDGRVIVSEYSASVVSILGNEGKLSFGNEINNIIFNGSYGIAITDDCCIIVADYNNHRIQRISMDGQYVTSFGCAGCGPMQLNYPRGIAISRAKKLVYIADTSNHRIQIFNCDLTFFGLFGKKGAGNGEFNTPHDVAIDNEGFVYVTDWNHRIQKFTHDGKYLTKFGSNAGQLNRPSGIAVDNAGLVYVSEYGKNCVSIFTSDGDFVRSFGEKGTGENQFKDIEGGITFDKDGRLYICDTGNDRIIVY